MEYLTRLYRWLHANRRKLATAAICLLASGLLVRVVVGPNGMVVYQRKRVEYRRLEQQINELQKENDALTQRTKALKTDPATIEKEAREQLRYAKPGEVIYVEPERKTTQPPANAAARKGN